MIASKTTKQVRGIEFDYAKAIPAAWELLWADNLKQRVAGNDYRGRTYYLTACDLEDQVRAFAQDQMDGKRWRSERAYGGYGFGGIRMAGDLQCMVRDWLLGSSKITGHNFGRGHISGMRFRPVGDPIGPAEKTIAKKIEQRANPKPKPVHFGHTYCRALCVSERLKKQKRQSWGRPNWRVHTDEDWEKVTCKQCLNLRATVQPKEIENA